MITFVPEWLFVFDSIIYIFSTMIGFVTASQLLKIYKFTSQKSHLSLYFGLVILSMAFLVLGMVSIYGYLNFKESCKTDCNTDIFSSEIVDVYDLGQWVYYLTSLVAYTVILTVYLPQKEQFPVVIPLMWSIGFRSFHLLSLFLLSYVIFRTVSNFFDGKNIFRFLIMVSFLALGGYHALLFFVSFNKIIYVLAHLSLLISFLSLMLMIFQVRRK